MKKIISLSVCLIFLMSCCNCKVKQTVFVISKTESISDSSNTFCKYHIKDHELDITDSIGKFKIGDTVVFQKRIRNNIDTNIIK